MEPSLPAAERLCKSVSPMHQRLVWLHPQHPNICPSPKRLMCSFHSMKTEEASCCSAAHAL